MRTLGDSSEGRLGGGGRTVVKNEFVTTNSSHLQTTNNQPETCAFLNGVIIPKTFSLKVVLAKFSSCALAVGSGIPAGPEGPMIHMGSILGSLVSQGQLFIGPHLEPLKAKIAHFKNIGDRRDFMEAATEAATDTSSDTAQAGI